MRKSCAFEIAIAFFEEYRNQGIGTDLMQQMTVLMKEKGYRQALSIIKGNPTISSGSS